MAFSRHSIRRVIGDMVNRHNGKTDAINSSPINQHYKNNDRSRKNPDRNSIISNGSLSVCI